jgi:hypothetical protein
VEVQVREGPVVGDLYVIVQYGPHLRGRMAS